MPATYAEAGRGRPDVASAGATNGALLDVTTVNAELNLIPPASF